MANQIPSPAEQDDLPDSRRWAVVALCLLVVGTATVVAGAALAFGIPTGLIVLGVLLLGGGIALGLMT